ncbi:unnamed protein product [Caenorhabditis nigoni]
MSILVELMEFVYFSPEVDQILISLLNIFNYLPEISLPFLLVCENLRQWKRVNVLNIPSQSLNRNFGRGN